MKSALILLACMLSLMCCPGCKKNPASSPPPTEDVAIDSDEQVTTGMTRAQVNRVLGQSTNTQSMVKTDSAIWGVIETWWDQLATGDRVEIWQYPTPKGTLEIYFLNDSNAVWHTAHVPKGIVF